MDPTYRCSDFSNYPNDVQGATSALIDNKHPLICGGFYKDVESADDQCFVLSPAIKKVVDMIEPRGFSASVALSSTRIWITGGKNRQGIDSNFSRSTEFIDYSRDTDSWSATKGTVLLTRMNPKYFRALK